jgi:phosphate transport system substrate-binding protein
VVTLKKKIPLLFVYFGAIPLGLSFFAFVPMFDSLLFTSIIPLSIGGVIVGILASRKLESQNELRELFSLFLYPLTYTILLWAIFMLISGGFSGAGAWFFYCLLHLPFAPIYFIAGLMGEGRLFFWAPLAYEVSFLIGALIILGLKKRLPIISKNQILSISVILILELGTGAGVQWQRSKTVLPTYGFEYGGGYSSTDLTPYEVTNSNNRLPKLESPSAFTIKEAENMPVLDGAEAAFPVYSAFANAAYEEVSRVNLEEKEIVSFTNTIYAFERLISGDVDIYFGAEPSKEQQAMAKRAGKELVMTPIGKEAFVFFVNPKNKVDSLTVEEIQGIYSGQITNWSDLGGNRDRIVPFQRPKNSGSQTLLEKIMGETAIMTPLKEEVPAGMGGIMEEVADYRNYKNAIGFSFRFFATGMNPNPEIKLLAINGVEPNPENISSGQYPFTANLYAITVKDNPNQEIEPFLNWMKGPQGQEIIEKIGYIRSE